MLAIFSFFSAEQIIGIHENETVLIQLFLKRMHHVITDIKRPENTHLPHFLHFRLHYVMPECTCRFSFVKTCKIHNGFFSDLWIWFYLTTAWGPTKKAAGSNGYGHATILHWHLAFFSANVLEAKSIMASLTRALLRRFGSRHNLIDSRHSRARLDYTKSF